MTAIDTLELGLLTAILFILISRNSTLSLCLGSKKSLLVLDSCGLIDGRVEKLIQSNVLPYELVIPDYILAELQQLADGKDTQKRLRAGHGLEVARNLQKITTVRTHTTQARSERSTDDRLLNTCKALSATLYTTDVPLTKLAALHAVATINVNELSTQLRKVVIPGDVISIELLRKGDGRNQAIGYTNDGSMVVVDTSTKYIGKQVSIKVTGTKETSSGLIIFGKKL